MKHFMVCINPECDKPFHELSTNELAVIALMEVPVTLSLDGSVPSLELAATALEDFLEVATQDKLKDMAYEKLKATQAILSQEGECSCPGCSEDVATETASVDTGDYDYYKSAEYKAQRVRMDDLEVERLKAEIMNQQAQTLLVEAKARLANAEAELVELKLPPRHRNVSKDATNQTN